MVLAISFGTRSTRSLNLKLNMFCITEEVQWMAYANMLQRDLVNEDFSPTFFIIRVNFNLQYIIPNINNSIVLNFNTAPKMDGMCEKHSIKQ